MRNKQSDQETLESMNQAVWYNQWTLSKFKRYLKGEILEIGCGIGNFTKSLTKYGNVWAIDIRKEFIEKTKSLVNEKAKVGFGDIEKGKYFFDGNKFDSIICLNVLEHIRNDDLALRNLTELLKSGGKLILLVPAHQFLFGGIDKSIDHFRRYNKLYLTEKLEKLGFKIAGSRKLNILGALGWFITGKILGKEHVDIKDIKLFNLFAPFILWLEDLVEPPIGTSILVIAEKK